MVKNLQNLITQSQSEINVKLEEIKTATQQQQHQQLDQKKEDEVATSMPPPPSTQVSKDAIKRQTLQNIANAGAGTILAIVAAKLLFIL